VTGDNWCASGHPVIWWVCAVAAWWGGGLVGRWPVGQKAMAWWACGVEVWWGCSPVVLWGRGLAGHLLRPSSSVGRRPGGLTGSRNLMSQRVTQAWQVCWAVAWQTAME
jgi:hypothetical protein